MKTRISRELRNVEGLTHNLPKMCEGHKCRVEHGHSYWIEVFIEGDVDENGLCAGVDTAEIEMIWKGIHPMLDHAGSMNKLPGLENPTTEIFARWLWDRFSSVFSDNHMIELLGVHVKEGYWSHCWVEGRPRPMGV